MDLPEAWEASYIRCPESEPYIPYICSTCWALITELARIHHYDWHKRNQHV